MQGHDAIHVRDLGMSASEDIEIIHRATVDFRIIVTQDTDYGTLLVPARRISPSVILFRMRDGRPVTQSAVLQRHLPDVAADLEEGAIVVISDGSIRVRRLSI
jgi:predicted nuclease of predicted toxin-antitoxin system